MNATEPIEVVLAGADHWRDIEQLFGAAGASHGCWCQYWILGAGYTRRDRADNQRDLARQVREGSAGLVAYRAGEPVGWARLMPRSDLEWLLSRFSRYGFGTSDAWALSCFFIARTTRGEGVMAQLIAFAASWGRERGTVIEGYPIDTDVKGATRNVFPGVLRAFLDAGFHETGRLAADRAVVVSGPRRPARHRGRSASSPPESRRG